MTEQEKILLEKSAELWNAYLALPKIHNEDIEQDFRRAIHQIQYIIMARPQMIKA
jgi:hypothetical protein